MILSTMPGLLHLLDNLCSFQKYLCGADREEMSTVHFTYQRKRRQAMRQDYIQQARFFAPNRQRVILNTSAEEFFYHTVPVVFSVVSTATETPPYPVLSHQRI